MLPNQSVPVLRPQLAPDGDDAVYFNTHTIFVRGMGQVFTAIDGEIEEPNAPQWFDYSFAEQNWCALFSELAMINCLGLRG